MQFNPYPDSEITKDTSSRVAIFLHQAEEGGRRMNPYKRKVQYPLHGII